MKLAIARDQLREAIGNVQSVVSTRSTLPMLQYVLMIAKNNTLKLISTDLEVGIECIVECDEVKQEGSVTLPCKKLHEVVNILPQGAVNLTASDSNSVTLTSGVVRYKLMGMPPDEFPKSPEVKRDEYFVIPQALLKEMLKKVSFSISTDPNRINITGLLFALTKNQLRLVSTDGRRLSYARHTLEKAPDGDKTYIIPRKTVSELERLLSDEGDVTIFLSENQIAFEFGNLLIISNLIDAAFPNYEQVVPRGYERKVIAEKEPFSIATKRAQVLTTDRYNLVKYEISPGKMVVTTNSPDIGEVKDELDVEYQGETIEIGFNPQFVIEVLKIVDEDKILLELKDSQSSGLLKPVDNEDYMYVVMPVRL
jgi:DNA polymerase-3 subunit beta